MSHLCEKFGDMIQTLVVLVRASMLPILYELLSRCCPNLKNLRIMEWTLTPSERGEETSLAWGRLPVRPNLVELHIETSKRRNEGVVRLRELTQLLVNSAPALRLVIVPDYVEFEDLKVKGNVKVIR